MNRLEFTYAAILVVHLLGLLLGISVLSTSTKPLLVLCLIGWVWQEHKSFRVAGLLVGSLIFSWLGDVLLMLPGEAYFVGGLVAFMSAHVGYIWIFSRGAAFHLIRILPFLAYAALLLSGPLNGKLPEHLKIPIVAYVGVLIGMGCMAALQRSRELGYEPILVGAILFILSDSFLALNTFVSPLPLGSFWVMLTYGLAQYLIVKGCLARLTSTN